MKLTPQPCLPESKKWVTEAGREEGGLHGPVTSGFIVERKKKQFSSWKGTGLKEKGAQLLL